MCAASGNSCGPYLCSEEHLAQRPTVAGEPQELEDGTDQAAKCLLNSLVIFWHERTAHLKTFDMHIGVADRFRVHGKSDTASTVGLG